MLMRHPWRIKQPGIQLGGFMEIPRIGGARGIFEIFIPGSFLLLNVFGALFFCPSPEIVTLIKSLLKNSGILIIVIICVGYLFGVMLRLFRTDRLDRISGLYMKLFYKEKDKTSDELKRTVSDTFPYINWINDMSCKHLPENVCNFFNDKWMNSDTKIHKKQFFNYCKTIIAAKDSNAYEEIYAAESLTRYVSGMFYSISLSLLLNIVVLVLNRYYLGIFVLPIILVSCIYILIQFEIIRRFRMLRIKEVETVFFASYINKDYI
jgi:hypothetical protein